MNQVWVHEQNLVSVHEVFPGVIPVLLWRIVPHPEVTVVAVVDVDLARGFSGAAGLQGESRADGATQSGSELYKIES